jgi:DNA-binding NtrC family response regulator
MAQILLAENDSRIRDFIAGILTDFGHGVITCRDCTEAVALLVNERIYVLVSDLVLAEGSTLARHCAAHGIPTITLAGQEFHAYQPERDRPLPLVDKPFRLDELQYVVDAVALACSSTRAAA